MAELVNLVTSAGDRFVTNLKGTFAEMSAQKWIRMVMIVGAYLLLRPYLMKLGAAQQLKAHEAAERETEEAAAKAEISPNQLRGQVDIPEDSDDEAGDGGAAQASASDWGRKARRRQRQVVKKLLDDHEKRLQEEQEDEEDKDIEEFLIKE